MDYQVFLTYIVLALIVAITIHILFKAFYSCNYKKSNEGFIGPYQRDSLKNIHNIQMDNSDTVSTNSNYETKISRYNDKDKYYSSGCNSEPDVDGISKLPPTYNSLDNSQTLENKIPNNLMPDEPKSSYEYSDDYIGGISNRTPNLIGSASCDINNTYANDFLMDENVLCPTKAPTYTREELQKYRDNFFDFRSHLWQQSAGVDPVDRMNAMLLSGDGDLPGRGRKISDVYDSLTGDRIHKEHCVMVQNLDNITMSPQYRMPGTLGDYYTKDNWIYNYDHVMNGALFYDNVAGVDPLMDSQMAIN